MVVCISSSEVDQSVREFLTACNEERRILLRLGQVPTEKSYRERDYQNVGDVEDLSPSGLRSLALGAKHGLQFWVSPNRTKDISVSGGMSPGAFPSFMAPSGQMQAEADISQIGSAATRNPAPPPVPGQSERISEGKSRLGRAAEPWPAGRSGLLWCRRSISAHSSPLSFSHHLVPSRQAAATGGPRKRSIRRRIAANKARGTATSASWNTT